MRDDVELTVDSWKCRKEARGFPQRLLWGWSGWAAATGRQV